MKGGRLAELHAPVVARPRGLVGTEGVGFLRLEHFTFPKAGHMPCLRAEDSGPSSHQSWNGASCVPGCQPGLRARLTRANATAICTSARLLRTHLGPRSSSRVVNRGKFNSSNRTLTQGPDLWHRAGDDTQHRHL
jgi:hypothetical protein